MSKKTKKTNIKQEKKSEQTNDLSENVSENTKKKKLKYNIIYNQDCIKGMKKIQDKTVDMVICDPPYNIGKNFGNNKYNQEIYKYIEWCKEWIDECLRILKDDGTMFIYGFSEILAFIRVELKCNVRWIIWHYTNKNVPRLRFWQRSHESILVCWKNDKIFNIDDIREPYTETYLKNVGKKRKATKGRYSNGDKETIYTAHKQGALPRDVIKIPALAGGAGKKERVGKIKHPTQKPLELCKKLLLSCRNKGKKNLLVVPFVGSGSECVAAKKLKIDYIGFEINKDYIKIAKERLK